MTDTVKNTAAGITVTFLETTKQTNGKHILLESIMEPTKIKKVPMHYHTTFTEEFTVLEGQLNILIGKQRELKILKAGDTVIAKPFEAHSFWNETNENVKYQVKIHPPKDYENTLRINHGLAADGFGSKKGGIPKSIWHKALLTNMGDTYYLSIPLWIQKLTFGLLAQIGKLLGKDKGFKKYIK